MQHQDHDSQGWVTRRNREAEPDVEDRADAWHDGDQWGWAGGDGAGLLVGWVHFLLK